jgi:Pyruvate-formate lyase-activating enzyme
MTVAYEVGNALYLNITNRCTNNCSFCVRYKPQGAGVLSEMNLWLEREPSVDEVIKDIQKRAISKYKELVFCGYGEPMVRTDDIIEICRNLKEKYSIPIRINTNGQANLIYGRDIAPRLEGLIDSVSISLNAKNKENYQSVCQSIFGDAAFDAVLDFAARCKKYVPKVTLSVVDFIPGEDIQICREIAQNIGVEFRVRQFAK